MIASNDPRFVVAFILLVGVGFHADQALATLAVDWGGDYVAGNVNMRGGTGGEVADDFEPDGTNDDDRTRIAFIDDGVTSLSPAIGASYSGTSAKFYGGHEWWHIDSSSISGRNNRIQNNGAADEIHINQNNGGSRRMYSAILWRQEDFLNGLNTGQLMLDSAAGGLSLNNTTNANSGNSSFRFLVKNGSDYLLSDFVTNSTGLQSLTGAALDAAMWAIYTPDTNGLRPEDPDPTVDNQNRSQNLTFNIATSALTDITGIGYYAELTSFGGGGTFEFQVAGFEAHLAPVPAAEETVVPEPATAAMVMLSCAGLVAMRRRRQ